MEKNMDGAGRKAASKEGQRKLSSVSIFKSNFTWQLTVLTSVIPICCGYNAKTSFFDTPPSGFSQTTQDLSKTLKIYMSHNFHTFQVDKETVNRI